VKPRHNVLHRQQQTNCSLHRAARPEDERSGDPGAAPRCLLSATNRTREISRWDRSEQETAVEGQCSTTHHSAEGNAPEPKRPGSSSPPGSADEDDGDARGRTAESPGDIPTRGWRDIGMRVLHNLGRDNTSLIAAGIGLNALLAVLPGLAVIVSVYGMFASPQDVVDDLRPFLGVLPADAARVLTYELQSLAAPANRTLGFGALFSAIVALWNSRRGMSALLTATNIAYKEKERRGLLRKTAISFAFILGSMLIFTLMLSFGVAVPLLMQHFPLGRAATVVVLVSRWLVLLVFAVLAFSLAYRFAPDRQPPKWRWVTWGSAIAALVWILGSLAFSAYVQNFGHYGQTYGALGGVIMLLMWFYLMGFTIVLGAEINAEIEHQTAVDTTQGPPEPMGRRGAYVADTLGRTSP
jgi:membrane protein